MREGETPQIPSEVKGRFGSALAALLNGKFGAAWHSFVAALEQAEKWKDPLDGRVIASIVRSTLSSLNDQMLARYGDGWADRVEVPRYIDLPKLMGGGEPSCSFCGKREKDVQQLIATTGVAICNECVGMCNDAIAERHGDSN